MNNDNAVNNTSKTPNASELIHYGVTRLLEDREIQVPQGNLKIEPQYIVEIIQHFIKISPQKFQDENAAKIKMHAALDLYFEKVNSKKLHFTLFRRTEMTSFYDYMSFLLQDESKMQANERAKEVLDCVLREVVTDKVFQVGAYDTNWEKVALLRMGVSQVLEKLEVFLPTNQKAYLEVVSSLADLMRAAFSKVNTKDGKPYVSAPTIHVEKFNMNEFQTFVMRNVVVNLQEVMKLPKTIDLTQLVNDLPKENSRMEVLMRVIQKADIPGYVDILKVLVSNYREVNKISELYKDELFGAVLMGAAGKNHIEVVKQFIPEEANQAFIKIIGVFAERQQYDHAVGLIQATKWTEETAKVLSEDVNFSQGLQYASGKEKALFDELKKLPGAEKLLAFQQHTQPVLVSEELRKSLENLKSTVSNGHGVTAPGSTSSVMQQHVQSSEKDPEVER